MVVGGAHSGVLGAGGSGGGPAGLLRVWEGNGGTWLWGKRLGKVLMSCHGILDRHKLILEACEANSLSQEDYIELGRAGVGTCLLEGLPDWLVSYSAHLVQFSAAVVLLVFFIIYLIPKIYGCLYWMKLRFINFERTKLPHEILKHNVEEKKKFFSEICLEVEKNDAEVQAEGVYNARLQNLALSLDKVNGIPYAGMMSTCFFPITSASRDKALLGAVPTNPDSTAWMFYRLTVRCSNCGNVRGLCPTDEGCVFGLLFRGSAVIATAKWTQRVRYVLRCVFGDPKKAPPPVRKLGPEALVSILWKGEGSLVEDLLASMAIHMEPEILNDLKFKIQSHDPSGFDNVQKELRKSLLWLRDELRNLPCTAKCRHDAAADLIHMYAYTKCFFKIREYQSVTSPPVYISPLDLGPKYAGRMGSGFQEYCKTYGVNYCLGQLIYWHSQNNADPDSRLGRARRGCLSLPDISSFYGKSHKPVHERVYDSRTVRFMLSRMVSAWAWPLKVIYVVNPGRIIPRTDAIERDGISLTGKAAGEIVAQGSDMGVQEQPWILWEPDAGCRVK
ncbi:putative histone-lysine N-methyltransferase ATXR3 [Platanthera guangdongensis]|uniref:Histone-lysine N-methyltransferase ATXR3 n=1 Tax=Platanthera guangdongensis TaxID=2320717 RepID=A0ABR2LIV7_9ASPA